MSLKSVPKAKQKKTLRGFVICVEIWGFSDGVFGLFIQRALYVK